MSKKRKTLTWHQLPSALETLSANKSLSSNHFCLLLYSSSAKTLLVYKTACFFYCSASSLFVFFNRPTLLQYHCFCLVPRWSGSPRTQIANGERKHSCCPCARKEKKKKWKEKNRATGEELRREKSKCLFMPNWATDEPAAISDSGLFAKEGGDEREGKEVGDKGAAEENEEQ